MNELARSSGENSKQDSVRRSQETNWMRFALKCLFSGAGFALMAGLIVVSLAWYASRPKSPAPWNVGAILTTDPPGFFPSDDGKRVVFVYSLDNKTNTDYHIDSNDRIKVVVKTKESTLSRPLSPAELSVDLPVFIPTKHKAFFDISMALSGIPVQKAGESDDEYHERIRGSLEEHLSNVGGFVVFDENNRYQINLPRWSAQRPKKQ